MKLRKEVQWFAEQMETKLRKFDGTKSWDNCSVDYLFDRILEERDELLLAMYKDKKCDINCAIEECVDVANFAMMLADRIRRISK